MLTPQKIMALDKMNAYALLKKKAVIGTGTLVTAKNQEAFIIGLGFSKNVLFEHERYVIPVINHRKGRLRDGKRVGRKADSMERYSHSPECLLSGCSFWRAYQDELRGEEVSIQE